MLPPITWSVRPASSAELISPAGHTARKNVQCSACGYSLHVDICHVRDVASFPDSATVGEVNAAENLIALDKRCHWEFDHGYLVYADGQIVARSGLEPLLTGL